MSAPTRARRGTSNSNARGNVTDRAARRAFLLERDGDGVHAPCYRCGVQLDDATITVDRVVPGVEGGRYTRDNIRPACGTCNSETGGALSRVPPPECLDCAALPTLAELGAQDADTLAAGVDYRPAKPRAIHPESGPRSPRCATHRRIWRKAGRQRASDKRSRKRSGLEDDLKAAVIAEQGGTCPCGAALVPKSGKRLNPIADHDHVKARQHDHPEDVACDECMRGYLCDHTNRQVIGWLARMGRTGTATRSDAEVARSLRTIADYLDDPPAQRVRRQRAAEVLLEGDPMVWFAGRPVL